jgi:hypothetical protein
MLINAEYKIRYSENNSKPHKAYKYMFASLCEAHISSNKSLTGYNLELCKMNLTSIIDNQNDVDNDTLRIILDYNLVSPLTKTGETRKQIYDKLAKTLNIIIPNTISNISGRTNLLDNISNEELLLLVPDAYTTEQKYNNLINNWNSRNSIDNIIYATSLVGKKLGYKIADEFYYYAYILLNDESYLIWDFYNLDSQAKQDEFIQKYYKWTGNQIPFKMNSNLSVNNNGNAVYVPPVDIYENVTINQEIVNIISYMSNEDLKNKTNETYKTIYGIVADKIGRIIESFTNNKINKIINIINIISISIIIVLILLIIISLHVWN